MMRAKNLVEISETIRPDLGQTNGEREAPAMQSREPDFSHVPIFIAQMMEAVHIYETSVTSHSTMSQKAVIFIVTIVRT
jgi:hypothetical protein